MSFEVINPENSFEKICVESNKLYDLLKFLKNSPENDLDRLHTIIAVDDGNNFELIYDLRSTKSNRMGRISVLLEKSGDRNSPHVPSVVGLYKSAYFDECEIYDMFGIIFDNNPDLKRLLMPKGWIGYPLRKDYKQEDERLVWND